MLTIIGPPTPPHTIKRISDELWDKIKIKIKIKKVLPKEKSPKTVGGRPIVPYRKVLDGILYVLRTRCQWKMLPKEHGSGSTIHRRFQGWSSMNVFKNIWIKLLKIYYARSWFALQPTSWGNIFLYWVSIVLYLYHCLYLSSFS